MRCRPQDEVIYAEKLYVLEDNGLCMERVQLIIRWNYEIQMHTVPIPEDCTLSPSKHCLSPPYIKRYKYLTENINDFLVNISSYNILSGTTFRARQHGQYVGNVCSQIIQDFVVASPYVSCIIQCRDSCIIMHYNSPNDNGDASPMSCAAGPK